MGGQSVSRKLVSNVEVFIKFKDLEVRDLSPAVLKWQNCVKFSKWDTKKIFTYFTNTNSLK